MPFILVLSFLLLIVIASFILLWPIVIHRDEQRVNRLQLNKKIYQERLDEIEQDAQNLNLSAAQVVELKEELAASLLQDVDLDAHDTADSGKPATKHRASLMWAVFFAFLMMGGTALYLFNGNYAKIVEIYQLKEKHGATLQAMIDGKAAIPDKFEHAVLPEQIRVLQSMMQSQREQARGWFMLALMYQEFQDFNDAIAAIAVAHKLQPENFEYHYTYAQLLLFANEMKFTKESYDMLNDLLNKHPNHEHLLFFKGYAAYQSGMLPVAAQSFRQLKSILPVGSDMIPMVDQLLAKIHGQLASPMLDSPQVAAAGIKPVVNVSITISEQVKSQLTAEHYLIVYAKRTDSPMPLAAVKQAIGAFPVTVQLSDENTMMASNSLSKAKQAFITARITKHQGVKVHPDDFVASSEVLTLKDGTQSVTLEIQ